MSESFLLGNKVVQESDDESIGKFICIFIPPPPFFSLLPLYQFLLIFQETITETPPSAQLEGHTNDSEHFSQPTAYIGYLHSRVAYQDERLAQPEVSFDYFEGLGIRVGNPEKIKDVFVR